jgi:hypothetical protein
VFGVQYSVVVGTLFTNSVLTKSIIIAFANSFRDLEVYKLARKLSREIFELTKRFPREKFILLLIRSEDHPDLLGRRLQKRGQKEFMKNILSANLLMLMESSRKPSIG